LPGLALVWPLALAFGLGMSLFDVAINTEGSNSNTRAAAR
jgi:hypothetical protein